MRPLFHLNRLQGSRCGCLEISHIMQLEAGMDESLNRITTKGSNARFIRVWQTSVSIAEAADRLAMPYNSVARKARELRKAGVYLKVHLRRRF